MLIGELFDNNALVETYTPHCISSLLTAISKFDHLERVTIIDTAARIAERCQKFMLPFAENFVKETATVYTYFNQEEDVNNQISIIEALIVACTYFPHNLTRHLHTLIAQTLNFIPVRC